jgi:hypothetical protein
MSPQREIGNSKMGLGLPTGGGGDFVTYIKYNAKAGRWYTKDDAGNEYEVAQMTAVFDFPNIKTGLMKFAAGSAPDYIFDNAVGSQSAQPPEGAEGYKRGFLMHLFANDAWQGVREFSSTAGVVNDQMNALYDAWESAPEKAQGKLPVITCVKVDAIEGKHGTNYAPDFAITGWTDRPAGLGDDAAPAPTPAPAAAVPPPTPTAPPAAAGKTQF